MSNIRKYRRSCRSDLYLNCTVVPFDYAVNPDEHGLFSLRSDFDSSLAFSGEGRGSVSSAYNSCFAFYYYTPDDLFYASEPDDALAFDDIRYRKYGRNAKSWTCDGSKKDFLYEGKGVLDFMLSLSEAPLFYNFFPSFKSHSFLRFFNESFYSRVLTSLRASPFSKRCFLAYCEVHMPFVFLSSCPSRSEDCFDSDSNGSRCFYETGACSGSSLFSVDSSNTGVQLRSGTALFPPKLVDRDDNDNNVGYVNGIPTGSCPCRLLSTLVFNHKLGAFVKPTRYPCESAVSRLKPKMFSLHDELASHVLTV